MSVVGLSRQSSSVRGAAWGVFNALQLAFTLLWTAGWICLASLVRLVTRGRHWPLRMASRRLSLRMIWCGLRRRDILGVLQC